jgi:MscS family membrane protein
VARAIPRLTRRTRTDLDDKVLEIVQQPIRRIVMVAGLYYALQALPLSDRGERIATGVVFTIAVYVAVRVSVQIVVLLLSAYARGVEEPGRQIFEKDYLPLVSKVLGVVLTVMGLIAVLHHFGQNVTSLVAALGVGGIAIGFAAKEILGNMLSGFAILVDRPFRPGDRIKLASGEIGDVIEVGTRSTRIKLLDQNMLIAPNSELVNTRVVNFNFPTHAVRVTLEVGLAWGADLDKAKGVILEVVSAQREVQSVPAPDVLITNLAGGVALQASYVISQFDDVAGVQDRIRAEIYTRLRKLEIEVK